MNSATKQKVLQWAEIIDSLRVFPRLFLLSCFIWTVYVTNELLRWYMALPKEDRGIEASGFASVVVLAVFGFLKLVYDTYSAAGRSWGPPPATTERTSATVVTSSTTVPTA